jgi:hypothetical protein
MEIRMVDPPINLPLPPDSPSDSSIPPLPVPEVLADPEDIAFLNELRDRLQSAVLKEEKLAFGKRLIEHLLIMFPVAYVWFIFVAIWSVEAGRSAHRVDPLFGLIGLGAGFWWIIVLIRILSDSDLQHHRRSILRRAVVSIDLLSITLEHDLSMLMDRWFGRYSLTWPLRSNPVDAIIYAASSELPRPVTVDELSAFRGIHL